MNSDDVERFQNACHLFADSVACFNETMAMTAENADRVSNGYTVAYTEATILELTQKYKLTEEHVKVRLG